MKLTITIAATLASFVHGTRYGLLRVGSPVDTSAPQDTTSGSSNQRSLFDEDFSLAFRQLFGYSAGLCMSAAPAQLSMSLAPLSLPGLNMSLGAGMSFAAPGMSLGTTMMYTTETTGETFVAADTSMTDGTPTSSSKAASAGTVAAVSAVALVAVAAVGAVVVAKSRSNVSSAASVGSSAAPFHAA